MKVCVTGANGFVGKVLSKLLESQNFPLLLASRTVKSGGDVKNLSFDIKQLDNFNLSLLGCDVVVHLAAYVHKMNASSKNDHEYFKVNTEATINLINQAVLAGVKRFIFVSSVKVFGESSPKSKPFLEGDDCKPEDAYGISKLKAEKALLEIAKTGAIEVVIIRPPLVYGLGVKANFASLIKLVKYGIPLPFGAINNKRSLIYVENLAHFIMHCLLHPAAKNQVFSVSDDHDVSTNCLIQQISKALNLPNRNIQFSEKYLFWLATIFGKQQQMKRLCGNLQVDISKAKNLLGWKPPYTFEQGLERTVENLVP